VSPWPMQSKEVLATPRACSAGRNPERLAVARELEPAPCSIKAWEDETAG